MVQSLNIKEFQAFLDFFKLTNIFMVELSIEENWIRSASTDSFLDDGFFYQADKQYPLTTFFDVVHESSHPTVHHSFTELKELPVGERYTYEYQLKYPEYEDRWFKNISIKTDEDRYLVLVQNISMRKNSEEEIRYRKDQNAIILDNIKEFVAQYNASGNLIYSNPAFNHRFFPEKVSRYSINTDSHDEQWFIDCMSEPYHSESVAYYKSLNDDSEIYIKWVNQALRVNQRVESVISVGVDVTKMQKSQEKLLYQLYHEERTGFLNPRGMNKKFEELSGNPFDLYYLKVSNIKRLHDLYESDVVTKFTDRISEMLRQQEASGLIVGCLYIDEYVIINDLRQHSRKSLERNLFNLMNQLITVDGNSHYVTTDIGSVSYPKDSDNLQSLLRYGGIAANYGREQRINRISRFSYVLYQQVRDDVSLINDLRKAMDRDEITIVYQEIIDSRTDKVAYLESLARWNNPQLGNIPPSRFFDLAARSYLGIELDFLIIKNSLLNFKELKKIERYKESILTFNITPRTLLSPSFAQDLERLVNEEEVRIEDICVEISEKTFVDYQQNYLRQINLLKSKNIKIALDDFGREYSSLGVINHINFDIIKVDKWFVDTLHVQSTQTILLMMNRLSHDLSCKIIVEGVETQQQLFSLKAMGYRYIQGYIYSRPQPVHVYLNNN